MTPDNRLFGIQTHTWDLQTEWFNSAIAVLARSQHSAAGYWQEGEGIRQITGLERQNQRIEGAERHRYFGLMI